MSVSLLLAEHCQHAPRDREAAKHVDGGKRKSNDRYGHNERRRAIGASIAKRRRDLDQRTDGNDG